MRLSLCSALLQVSPFTKRCQEHWFFWSLMLAHDAGRAAPSPRLAGATPFNWVILISFLLTPSTAFQSRLQLSRCVTSPVMVSEASVKAVGDKPKGSLANKGSPQDVISSFEARQFEPAWWARNPHVQTIHGSRALVDKFAGLVGPRDAKKRPRRWEEIYDRRERVTTPDSDWFSVDYLFTDVPHDGGAPPIAVILHGLESASSALLPRSMAKAFARRGFDVAAVNFRGCCGTGDNDKPQAYHLGFTDDLHYMIETLHSQNPERRIYLSGFSLGGNVILKCLGELGTRASELNVAGAAVACVPFDAVRSSGKIDRGFNGVVYAGNFLSTLIPKAVRKWEASNGVSGSSIYDIERVRKAKKIQEFDDAVIAVLHNFTDAFDYYRQSCSKAYLARITVPTFAVNAIDDPFIEADGLPTDADVNGAPVKIVYHEHGGHCGFVADNESKQEEERWLPTELARFLDHVEGVYRHSST